MKRKFTQILWVLGLLPLIACSSAPEKSPRLPAQEYFGTTPLAPNNLSKNEIADSDKVVDALHLRSQADFHYTRGEALSMDGDSAGAIEEFKLTLIYDAQSASVRLRLAAEYLRQGLLTEALEHAEQALKYEPENIDVHVFLGGLYSALKMYKQALEHYQFVLTKDPNNDEVPIYIGALYVEQDMFDEAEASFMKVTHIPDSEKTHLAYYYIGKMRFSQGPNYFKLAEKAFTRALQEKPDFEDGVLALAELQSQQGRKKQSIELLESFQEQFGPKKSIAFQLSQTYLEDENYEKAFKHLRVLESFEPKNLNVKVKVALILIEQKKYDEAIDKLEEIIAMAPNSDKIRFYLAAVYEETGKFPLAIENFKKIETSSTYYPDAIVHAAFMYRKQQDLKSADELLSRAIAARSDVPQFYSFYASILDEEKEYSKGLHLLEGAIKKFPDNTQLHFYLGSIYDRVGKTDQTVAEMRKVLDLDPEYVQALNYLAYTYSEMGKNLDEAELLARKAMKLQPNDGYILDTLGWVLFKMGRIDEAVQYLESAYKAKSDESIIAEHLGDAYYVFELTEKAKQMYLKAAATENDQTKVNKLRAKISTIDAHTSRTPASVGGP